MNNVSKYLSRSNRMARKWFPISCTIVAAAAMACLVPAAALQAGTVVDGVPYTETNSTVGPDSPAVKVINDGTYIIDGANVTANNATGSDVGIQLGTSVAHNSDPSNSSGNFIMTGGSFTSHESDSSTASTHGYGLVAYNDSTVNISGGTFKATETGKGHNFIIQMFDNSTGTIGGTAELIGTENSNGFETSIDLHGNASLTVSGGSISHTSLSPNGSPLFKTADSSTLEVSDGTFFLDSDNQNLNVFDVEGQSVASITGGEVTALDTTGEKRLAQLNNDGKLNVSGGKFPTGLDIIFSHDSTDQANVTIYGSDFVLDGSPIGLGSISQISGTLSGTLADGNLFEFNFNQQNPDTSQEAGALIVNRIMLAEAAAGVPEPGSITLALIGLAGLGLVRLGRRRRAAAIRH
jgi:hypothetical protein